ncbi:DNA-binding domain-containing protein [Alloalcanivorax marinus]|uniref:HvfC family RiPP maturation protein n=1 Tax=Alloalcanivorax marinus TaxID=1177169 RepID=UPI001EE49ECF|nr:putative DNA-binding domain-containing protein [Alloalcanivorax marinus]
MEPEFQRIQRRFAAHLRDPERHPAPEGIEERRLAIYRTLFFNNINGFLEKGFPVLRALYADHDWRRLVRAFFDGHRSASPYFLDIPGEFVRFLDEEYSALASDPPFLVELAHYEWMEVVIDTRQDTRPTGNLRPEGDLLRGVPCLSPLHAVLQYRWPVHRIGPDYRPGTPPEQPVWLLVYRDQEERVAFMEINAVTARLLALIEAHPSLSGAGVLALLAEEMAHPDPRAVRDFGAELLAGLRQRGLILGTWLTEPA